MKAAAVVVAATATGATAFHAPLVSSWTSGSRAAQCCGQKATCSSRSHTHSRLHMSEAADVDTNTSLGSTTLLEQPESKFERKKKTYKGLMSNLDAEDLDLDDMAEEMGFGYGDFATMLNEQKVAFTRGEVVKGTVAQYEKDGALIDIGSKSGAYLPLREAGLAVTGDIDDVLGLEDEVEVMIVSNENEWGQVTVSIRRLEFEKAWERVQAMQSEDAVFESEIVAVNRGGAIVMVEGLRAFLPGSHLCGGLPTEELVGQKMSFKFLEVNPEANKLVVSNRRAVLEQEMQELSRGDVVEGVVKALKPYGAFVEIRGMSGLLHISQISYDRIEDLSSIVAPGMAMKCMIIDHDKINGRIALSTKTLEPEPGDMLRNPQKVFDEAEQTAALYHERMETERKAREEAAKSIVMGLGDGLADSFDSDMLSGIADGIESVLNPLPQAVESAANPPTSIDEMLKMADEPQ